MGKKKTNAEHLRDIIEKNMPESNKDEAMEFVEAMEIEISEKADEVKDLEDEIENIEETEPKYDNEVEYGNGPKEALYWKCDNLAVQSMMEALEDKLAKCGPLKIEQLLNLI